MKTVSARRRLPVATLVPALYALATGAIVVCVGIPYQRDIVALWLLLGVFCCSLGDLRGAVRGIVLEWLPFMAILLVYDVLRGSAGHVFAVHYLPQLDADRFLGGGIAPTVWLQHTLWHGRVAWYDVVAWLVYLSHFWATPILATLLWRFARARFRLLAVRVALLSCFGLLTYAVYPAAPPWMAADAGLLSPVTRIIHAVFHSLGVHSAGSLVEHGYAYANAVAAVPSLHAAFALLLVVTAWPVTHRRLRALLALYPLAMGFALVYTAEHYVADILLGWLYAAVAIAAGRRLHARWAARRAALVAAAAEATLVPARP